MKQKQYAISIQAGTSVFHMQHDIYVTSATSKKTALECAERFSLSRFPAEKGYRFRTYKVAIVPEQ